MKTAIGIDPGKSGAVCIMRCLPNWDIDAIDFEDTPTMKAGTGGKREYDEARMAEIIRDAIKDVDAIVSIEKQQAMPPMLHGRPQGTVSSFQTGYGFGVWVGVVAAAGVPFQIIHPATWKKDMLRDQPKGGKEVSRMVARRMFPWAADLMNRVKDEARAEALLLCEFGRRRWIARAA